jgi:hypothetical protein
MIFQDWGKVETNGLKDEIDKRVNVGLKCKIEFGVEWGWFYWNGRFVMLMC